jgi:hypothetical protein
VQEYEDGAGIAGHTITGADTHNVTAEDNM